MLRLLLVVRLCATPAAAAPPEAGVATSRQVDFVGDETPDTPLPKTSEPGGNSPAEEPTAPPLEYDLEPVIVHKPRPGLLKPRYGAHGPLLSVGVYPLNFAFELGYQTKFFKPLFHLTLHGGVEGTTILDLVNGTLQVEYGWTGGLTLSYGLRHRAYIDFTWGFIERERIALNYIVVGERNVIGPSAALGYSLMQHSGGFVQIGLRMLFPALPASLLRERFKPRFALMFRIGWRIL